MSSTTKSRSFGYFSSFGSKKSNIGSSSSSLRSSEHVKPLLRRTLSESTFIDFDIKFADIDPTRIDPPSVKIIMENLNSRNICKAKVGKNKTPAVFTLNPTNNQITMWKDNQTGLKFSLDPDAFLYLINVVDGKFKVVNDDDAIKYKNALREQYDLKMNRIKEYSEKTLTQICSFTEQKKSMSPYQSRRLSIKNSFDLAFDLATDLYKKFSFDNYQDCKSVNDIPKNDIPILIKDFLAKYMSDFDVTFSKKNISLFQKKEDTKQVCESTNNIRVKTYDRDTNIILIIMLVNHIINFEDINSSIQVEVNCKNIKKILELKNQELMMHDAYGLVVNDKFKTKITPQIIIYDKNIDCIRQKLFSITLLSIDSIQLTN